MDFEDFIKDKKTIYAVISAIEIIGEATKTYSRSNKEEISGCSMEIRWPECETGWFMNILE